jgi:hypothetical protein
METEKTEIQKHNPISPAYVDANREVAIVRKLSQKFGPMTSNSGVFTRIDGGEVPQEAIEQAKKDVEQDGYWYMLKMECQRRIMMVTKDMLTQINILTAALSSRDAKEAETARQLIAWMAQMRDACRRMRNGRKHFTEDRYWPTPPPGVRDLVEKY